MPKNRKDCTYSFPLTKDLNRASALAAKEIGFDRTKITTSLFMYISKHKRLPQELIGYCIYLEAGGRRSIFKHPKEVDAIDEKNNTKNS